MYNRSRERLGVSAAALFYTPGEKSGDDSLLAAADRITDAELARAAEAIKLAIRRSVL